MKRDTLLRHIETEVYFLPIKILSGIICRLKTVIRGLDSEKIILKSIKIYYYENIKTDIMYVILPFYYKLRSSTEWNLPSG